MIPRFRAWYGEKMYEVAKLDLWGDREQATCELASLDFDEEELYDIYLHEVELMQFTGLYDKYGVEIYEGDVIIDHLLNSTNGKYFAVAKHYNYFYPKMIKNGKIYNNIIDPIMFDKHSYQKGIEVVGNIYKNPELLEVEE